MGSDEPVIPKAPQSTKKRKRGRGPESSEAVPGLPDQLSQVREFNAKPRGTALAGIDLRRRDAVDAVFNTYPSPVPLRFNARADTTDTIALRETDAKRRSGLRRKAKGKRFDPVTHEVVTDGTIIELLTLLVAIVEAQQAHDASRRIDPEAEEPKRLFIEFDLVESWELRNEDKIAGKRVSTVFINHTVANVQSPSYDARFWFETYLHGGTILADRPNFAAESWPVFMTALQEAEELVAPSSVTWNRDKPKSGRSRRKRRLSQAHDEYSPAPSTKRQKNGGGPKSRYQSIAPNRTPGGINANLSRRSLANT
ncbi:hypothetical protein ABVK25_012445 [Lepraria finkii]|uniref:Uncharacterized protein n=1 Tax=Lepraria finkii TaxID=1340010 RepID=A0ABR4AE53_9LECA